MLKTTAFLASLLLSSTVLASGAPDASPYPEGAPPQKASSNDPGDVSTDRLGKDKDAKKNMKDEKNAKDAKNTKDGLIKDEDSEE